MVIENKSHLRTEPVGLQEGNNRSGEAFFTESVS